MATSRQDDQGGTQVQHIQLRHMYYHCDLSPACVATARRSTDAGGHAIPAADSAHRGSAATTAAFQESQALGEATGPVQPSLRLPGLHRTVLQRAPQRPTSARRRHDLSFVTLVQGTAVLVYSQPAPARAALSLTPSSLVSQESRFQKPALPELWPDRHPAGEVAPPLAYKILPEYH